jgi:hypothetical protein
MLHRLSPWTLLGVAATAGVPFRVVPRDYWHAASDVRTQSAQVLIDCVCGTATLVEMVTLTECGCGRTFFYAGPEVLAYGGPAA